MNSETVNKIIEAEKQAAEIKKQAEQIAQNTIRDAEKQAADKKLCNTEECKKYRSAELLSARTKADAEYDSLIKQKKKEAEQFVVKKTDEAAAAVGNIIGRIVGGDC